MPVRNLLDASALLVQIALDEHRDAGSHPAVTSQLRTHLHALHQELGRVRVITLTRPTPVRREYRDGHLAWGRTLLRQLRLERSPLKTVDAALDDRRLTLMFDHLEQLALGLSPEDTPDLQIMVQLNGALALMQTFRAPGMALPPLVELAAGLSGADPLWAWQFSLTDPSKGRITEALADLVSVLLFTQHFERCGYPGNTFFETLDLARTLRGHLLALMRRHSLRFPEHALVETYLRDLGAVRATPLTDTEAPGVRQRLMALQREAILNPRPQAEPGLEQGAPLEDETDASTSPDLPEAPTSIPVRAALPAHVQAARSVLAGRRVTLLGGVPRPAHHAALVQALGLDWIGAAAYQHGTHAAAHVREDTAVVMLAVRWMGHAHNTLRDVARERGVPYVMLPGGLNPSAVAYQVMQQVSGQLTPTRADHAGTHTIRSRAGGA